MHSERILFTTILIIIASDPILTPKTQLNLYDILMNITTKPQTVDGRDHKVHKTAPFIPVIKPL